MGLGRDRTRHPWICSQAHICCQTCYRLLTDICCIFMLIKQIIFNVKTLWTFIRLFYRTLSDMGPHCLQFWHPKDNRIFYKNSKTCVKQPLSKRPKLVFKTNYRLMQVKVLQNAPMGAFCNTFRPSLSYHLSLRSLFCLFLSSRFTQV